MTWRWVTEADDGSLVFGDAAADRPDGALRVDARLAAGGSDARWVSLCRFEPPGSGSYAFDDPAVSQALRRRLQGPWPEAVSTLLVDWSRIGGAITIGLERDDVADDPFAQLFPRRLLEIEPGTLGAIPRPTGPGITRYGSGNPWPWDVYRGQVA